MLLKSVSRRFLYHVHHRHHHQEEEDLIIKPSNIANIAAGTGRYHRTSYAHAQFQKIILLIRVYATEYAPRRVYFSKLYKTAQTQGHPARFNRVGESETRANRF